MRIPDPARDTSSHSACGRRAHANEEFEFMRLRSVVIREGSVVSHDEAPTPDLGWHRDGAMRWLLVQGGMDGELASVLESLGADGVAIEAHVKGSDWLQPLESQGYSVAALPELTSWNENRSWFHVVLLPQTLVSVHAQEIEAMDSFVQRRWLARPAPRPTLEDLLLFFIEALTMEETAEFGRIRFDVERHAAGLKAGPESVTVEQLEDLMTRSHHMSTVFFEMQRLVENVEFSRASLLNLAEHREYFRLGIHALRRRREGVEQIQRRMEELQRQHIMDQQARAEGRLRALTILSAVFLPLTLISGIYGMNFVHMPELDEANAYFMVLGGMGILAGVMVLFFVVKGWFR
jgi:magnesium transporter